MRKSGSIIKRASVLVVLALAFSGLAPVAAQIANAAEGPSIASDKADYAPGEHVVLTGSGWQAGEPVNIDVNDDEGSSWRRNVDVTADGSGDIRDEFNLPDWFVATYSVVATGATSGTARTTFTDGNVQVKLAGGPTSANLSVTKFNTNTTCSGAGDATTSEPVNNTTFSTVAGTGNNQSARVTAAVIPGYTFSSWSGAVTSTSTSFCRAQPNGNALITANYTVSSSPTSLAVAPASGPFGGTTDLSATLTSGGGTSPVSGKSIAFTLNGGATFAGTTNTSGVATVSGVSLSGINAGSYPTGVAATFAGDPSFFASSGTGSLTVGKASTTTTVTCEAGPFAYTGSAHTPCSATVTGPGLNESISVGYADNINAGTATASASYEGAGNYAPSSDSETFTIDKANTQVTITCEAGPFTYDGEAHEPCTAVVTGPGLEEPVPVTYQHNVNAGTATANAAYTPVGGNYHASSNSQNFTIDRASTTTTVTCEAGPFAYTGSAHTPCSATVTGPGLNESISVGYADNIDAGTATASASYEGAGNYAPSSDSETFTIDKANTQVTITCEAGPFTYDGEAHEPCTAVVSGPGLDESVTVTYQDNVNAGTATASATYPGAANYHASSNTQQFAIGQLAVVGSFTADDKVYDGDTSAIVLTRSLSDPIVGDDVSLVGGTASFDTKDVGTDKTVTLTGASLGGADADNYTLDSVDTTTADITPLAITGTFSAENKVYDGTTDATVTGRDLSGVIAGDDVELTGGNAAFDTKDVGADKTVTLTDATLEGADAGNYALDSVAPSTADITQRDLTVTVTGANKTYDGTNAAAVTLHTNKVAGDTVNASYTSATFSDENVGTAKTVSVSGISIGGTDAGNYNLLNTTATTTADITRLAVMGAFTAANKVYDGTTSATVTSRSLVGTVAGDDVSLVGGTAAFNNALVGTGKTVILTGATLSGSDAGNYTLTSVATTTASILPWSASGKGFYAPVGVDNSEFVAAPGAPPAVHSGATWNTIKGGQTVPLKFNVFAGTVEQTATSAITGFTAVAVSCTAANTDEDAVDFTTTGGTALRYDATDRQFIQNWKTPTGTGCYRATVKFADGSSLSAFFKTKK
jgi:hypothetical protein